MKVYKYEPYSLPSDGSANDHGEWNSKIMPMVPATD